MFRKGLFALGALLLMSAGVWAEVYQIPKDWVGKDKTSDNNPVLVDGKAMWRFDRLWPDDAYDSEAYVPMVWAGGSWVGKDHNFAGQPAASYSKSTLTLNCRSQWGGGGDGDGNKLPALAFIAPKAGKYKLEGKVMAEIWEGGGVVKLLILTRDVKKKDIAEVKVLEFSKDKEAPKPQSLAETEVTLAEGQELILTASATNANTGYTFTVAQFKIATAE